MKFCPLVLVALASSLHRHCTEKLFREGIWIEDFIPRQATIMREAIKETYSITDGAFADLCVFHAKNIIKECFRKNRENYVGRFRFRWRTCEYLRVHPVLVFLIFDLLSLLLSTSYSESLLRLLREEAESKRNATNSKCTV